MLAYLGLMLVDLITCCRVVYDLGWLLLVASPLFMCLFDTPFCLFSLLLWLLLLVLVLFACFWMFCLNACMFAIVGARCIYLVCAMGFFRLLRGSTCCTLGLGVVFCCVFADYLLI